MPFHPPQIDTQQQQQSQSAYSAQPGSAFVLIVSSALFDAELTLLAYYTSQSTSSRLLRGLLLREPHGHQLATSSTGPASTLDLPSAVLQPPLRPAVPSFAHSHPLAVAARAAATA